MTNRDELFAMSNAELGAWIDKLMHSKPLEDGTCGHCPADAFCTKEVMKALEKGRHSRRLCAETIADWLRAEAEAGE